MKKPQPAKKNDPRPDSKQTPDDTKPNDVVDEASDESFPASDPPAWTETAASKNDG